MPRKKVSKKAATIHTMKNRGAVIGGGAAGMMAAVSVHKYNSDFEVLIFEKNNNLGAKVLISGGGRCNVTTGIHDRKKLLENYPRGAAFLKTAMYDFPPEKVMQWFEDHGVKLKTEEDLRVFPKSNNGKDIVGALEKALLEKKTQILLGKNVTSITKNGEKFIIKTAEESYEVDFVIITTGGNAYRHTGSTGDGYAFAKSLGHTITQLGPSLNSFVIQDECLKDLTGVSFEKATLSFISADSERKFQRTGPFLFTHRGVTGPAVFALSALTAFEEISQQTRPLLKINFFPEESAEALRKRIQESIEKNAKKHLVNFLDFFLPKSLCEVIAKITKISPSEGVGNLRKEQRTLLFETLQGMPLSIIGRGTGDEFVTAGGVNLSEVSQKTMESAICPGLFFAGEILDIDGFTGGFNLQASWATGHLAGKSIHLHEKKRSV